MKEINTNEISIEYQSLTRTCLYSLLKSLYPPRELHKANNLVLRDIHNHIEYLDYFVEYK